jgi:hypothetical protein
MDPHSQCPVFGWNISNQPKGQSDREEEMEYFTILGTFVAVLSIR